MLKALGIDEADPCAHRAAGAARYGARLHPVPPQAPMRPRARRGHLRPITKRDIAPMLPRSMASGKPLRHIGTGRTPRQKHEILPRAIYPHWSGRRSLCWPLISVRAPAQRERGVTALRQRLRRTSPGRRPGARIVTPSMPRPRAWPCHPPDFAAIANRPSTTALSLKVFFETKPPQHAKPGHPRPTRPMISQITF